MSDAELPKQPAVARTQLPYVRGFDSRASHVGLSHHIEGMDQDFKPFLSLIGRRTDNMLVALLTL